MIWFFVALFAAAVNCSPVTVNSTALPHLEKLPPNTNLSIVPLATNTDCKAAGYTCLSSCNELVLCVDLGSSVYHAALIAQCNTSLGQFCSAENLDCSGKFCTDDGAKSQDFVCKAKGSFPHPYDCTQYYICTTEGNVIKPTKCGVNTSYSVASGKCDGGLNSRACKESPVDKCLKVGQTGAIAENKVLFYVCEVNKNEYLLPNLYACTNGFEYDATDKICKKKETPSGDDNGGGSGSALVFNVFVIITGLVLSRV